MLLELHLPTASSRAKKADILGKQQRRISRHWLGAGLGCLALLASTSSVSIAQAGLANGTLNGTLNDSQTGKREYRFEVAVIRPADPSGMTSRPPNSPGARRFMSESTTIVGLAMRAFGLKEGYQIEYKPWMLSTYFSVNATYPDGATKADLPIMVQHLLEDRFALVYKRQTRQMDGYRLVVAKFGPKLTRAAPVVPEESATSGSIVVKNGEPQFAANASGILMSVNGATLRGRSKTMKDLAGYLAMSLHKPVVDATGLDGAYDYTIDFVPPEMELDAGQASPPSGSASLPLPAALESRLGLKLQSAKNISTDVVVLEAANKKPTEN